MKRAAISDFQGALYVEKLCQSWDILEAYCT